MILGGSNILGLACGERSIACAEISTRGGAGGRRVVRRLASFAMGPNNAAEKPGELGQQLASFLRRNGFAASRVVVGVPAKWLIAVEREVPPAGAEEVRAALRLQAERMSGTTEGGELVFDHVGELSRSNSGGAGSKVLLVGILRRQLERVQAIAEAAGLNVVAVTSSALTLAGCDHAENPEASTVVLERQGAEVVWRQAGAPVMLRHVTVGGATNGHVAAAVGALGKELRRNVTLLKPAAASNGHGTSGSAREVALWDLMGLSSAEVAELSEQLGVQVRPVSSESALGLQVSAEVLAPESEVRLPGENRAAPSVNDQAVRYGPAIALALAGSRRELPLDLAHSRLAPPQERRFGRTGLWAAVLGALLVLGLGALVWDVQARKSEAAELKSQLATIDPDVKAADTNVAKLTYGRGYFETRPPMLECLREITLAFREDEPIWVGSMNFRDTHAGQLNGKSTDQRYVLAVLDRMKKDPKFSDVKLLDMRDAGGKSKEIAFSISFTFEGDE